MSTQPEKKTIVIIGGGIVGVSTAYFLTSHAQYNPAHHSIILLEASDIATGSSGKAGGFIASWATPKCIAPLGFRLHESLAQQYSGDKLWGYRRVHAAEMKLQGESQAANPPASSRALKQDYPPSLDWLNPRSVKDYKEIGTPQDSAQVHPFLLTRALARFAEERGVKVILGTATSINSNTDSAGIESVTYTTSHGMHTTVEATDILIAAGPWSSKLLPAVKLLTPKCHSIVIRPPRDVSAYILFPTILSSAVQAPDIYPRPEDSQSDFKTIYSSGPDYYDDPLPTLASEVVVEDEKCTEVWTAIKSITSQDIHEGEVIVRQACYKAQVRKHEEGVGVGPIVGPMNVKGLWLATGLDEWGIQNGPVVGLLMSEMILEGKERSANVESLYPKHWI